MKKKEPKTCINKSNRRYFVKLNGKKIYLGKLGDSPDTLQREKNRVLAEFYATASVPIKLGGITLDELILRFFKENYRHFIRLQAFIFRLRQIIRWGTGESLVPAGVAEALKYLEPLKEEKCDAPDHPPREIVASEIVEKTIHCLSPTVEASRRSWKRASGFHVDSDERFSQKIFSGDFHSGKFCGTL